MLGSTKDIHPNLTGFIIMKQIAAITILLFLGYNSVVMADSVVKEIRKEYKTIKNSLSSLKHKTIELNDYSADGGGAKAYFDKKGIIRFIRAEFYGESGKVFEEYFYKDRALIFVFREEHHYNVPYYVKEEITKDGGTPGFDPKKTTIIENRYYFHNKKMVRWLDKNKKQVSSGSKEYKEKGKDIIEFSNKLVNKFQLKTSSSRNWTDYSPTSLRSKPGAWLNA